MYNRRERRLFAAQLHIFLHFGEQNSLVAQVFTVVEMVVSNDRTIGSPSILGMVAWKSRNVGHGIELFVLELRPHEVDLAGVQILLQFAQPPPPSLPQ